MAEGVLVLVTGPSGAGKDSLIDAARNALRNDPHFVFPIRLITRADMTGEEHAPLTVQEFASLREAGGFFLHWEAHGLSYALPGSVDAALKRGQCVVANVSRKAVEAARANWQRVEVISVTVDPHVLKARLMARGRETPAQIEDRVRRASDPACAVTPPVHCIGNSGAFEQSAAAFLHLLRHLSAEPENTAA